ncbi:HTTM domain-containing protein [Microbacterium sp. NIBRBAC000506063]|uniref:HTTM domain-containing protein n=1 Tax=Microbacterium sp. NIBRBAC000506063 TaxID=2734618 RepID=UPI001BB4B1EB|nr:HTTM domain-containing protein [Microbacterium sp. NIBRBAC000506063]QTV80236.1 HTTM domain-containing protein [Microbacterium sp. NIBRBAC000506063]
MTLVILALSAPHLSYSFGSASHWGEARTSVSSTNEYFWPLPFPFSRDDPDVVLYIKVAILFAVAVAYTLGWRMRIISPLFVFLWLGFTTLNPVITNSGHYQTFRIMVIVMLLADLSRRWSLDARRRARRGERTPDAGGKTLLGIPAWFTNLLNNVAVILIGFQLCMIYITSALWKLQGSTWITGVAVYYPLRLEELTLFPWLNTLVWHITPLVFVSSWVSIYLQLLFPLLLLNRWTRIVALIGITGMHAGIGILMALPFFSLLMIAGDMIFIREESWAKARAYVQRRRSARRKEPEQESVPEPQPAA